MDIRPAREERAKISPCGATTAEFFIPETRVPVGETLEGSQCDAAFLPLDPTPHDRSMIVPR
ncbi:hypothetical protein ABZ791_28705 [Streptomyces huasconensis]|uniref:Uncharacterized protein n=2 Tax=Streptomyces huasconensis TaxID=1854574 RepID=A0ABV3LWX0_9ACTN